MENMMEDTNESIFTSEDITRLLNIIVGSSTAVGDSAADRQIAKNLEMVIDVCEWCLDRLDESAKTMERPEGSMRDIGTHAYSYICGIKDWADRVVGEQLSDK